MQTTQVNKCPCLLIAAPSSGSGKTTVTAALARYHSRLGKRVSVFKAGPDFIDPMILRQASRREVYSLDFGMMSREHCGELLHRAASNSDLIIIEGVMGLYDGRYSAADIAEAFGISVAIVVDVKAMAETFAAVVHGLATLSPTLRVWGAFANRNASVQHGEMVKEGLSKYSNNTINWLGNMPFNESIAFPERHLGLVQAEELQEINGILDTAADLLEGLPITEIPPVTEFSAPEKKNPLFQKLKGKIIVIAKDKAFSFIYAANIDFLVEQGAEVLFVSPLEDKFIPKCDLLYFPGGYPELHAEALSANKAFIDVVKNFNGNILAECGGMIYLSQSITINNKTTPMCGRLPLAINLENKLQAIGWQKFQTEYGELMAHSFHYTSSTLWDSPLKKANAEKLRGETGEDIYFHDKIIASYLHWYFPSNHNAALNVLLLPRD